jgi:hypothetical protein
LVQVATVEQQTQTVLQVLTLCSVLLPLLAVVLAVRAVMLVLRAVRAVVVETTQVVAHEQHRQFKAITVLHQVATLVVEAVVVLVQQGPHQVLAVRKTVVTVVLV